METVVPKLAPKREKYIAVPDSDKCVGCQLCMYACSRRFGDAGLAHSAILIQAALDFERGFLINVCRSCEDPPCTSVCPTKALTPRKGSGVIFKQNLCIGCHNCVAACTINAIQWDISKNKAITCVYCGLCATACPHGVLEFWEKKEVRPNAA